MNQKTLGVIAVVLIAIGIVAYKATRPRDTALADPSPSAATASMSVVLVADPEEAESSCICGQIIRSVRGVRGQGVSVKEVDPEKAPDVAKSYRALVNPTVLVVDSSGKEMRRFEGEDKATYAAIRAELDRIAKRP
jgi:hypothetical protein